METTRCYDLTKKQKDMLNALALTRHHLRRFISSLDADHHNRRVTTRKARKLRDTGNRFDARRADLIESDLQVRDQQTKVTRDNMREYIREIGRLLLRFDKDMEAYLPQALLLDFLEVNPVDRKQVKPGDGLVEVIHLNRLEQSAYYRGNDFSGGPFAEAIIACLHHELIHNEEMQKQADTLLFGKGGMFEFIPMYKKNEQGEMVRQPSPLRLA